MVIGDEGTITEVLKSLKSKVQVAVEGVIESKGKRRLIICTKR